MEIPSAMTSKPWSPGAAGIFISMGSKYSSLSLSPTYLYTLLLAVWRMEFPKLATQPGEVKQTESLGRPASGWIKLTDPLAHTCSQTRSIPLIARAPHTAHSTQHTAHSQQCAFVLRRALLLNQTSGPSFKPAFVCALSSFLAGPPMACAWVLREPIDIPGLTYIKGLNESAIIVV